MQRPGRPVGTAGTEYEVGFAGANRVRDLREIRAVEGAVAIHEAHDVSGRGGEAGETRRPESATGLDDHSRSMGARDVGGVVVRPVVDDDRVVSDRQPGDDGGNRSSFIQRG